MTADTAKLKAELEANGYELLHKVDGWFHHYTVLTPDKKWLHNSLEIHLDDDARDALDELVRAAYAHLQERRELAALRKYAHKVSQANVSKLHFPLSYMLESQNLVQQFNITEADDDDDISEATRDRLADIYSDESDDE